MDKNVGNSTIKKIAWAFNGRLRKNFTITEDKIFSILFNEGYVKILDGQILLTEKTTS